MKKVLLFSLLFFSFIANVNASTNTASSYVLMDMDTGRVIESKNKDTPMLIASITKIMTCIIAIIPYMLLVTVVKQPQLHVHIINTMNIFMFYIN